MLMYASASSARLTWWTAHGEESIRKYLVNVLKRLRLRLLMRGRSMPPRAGVRGSSASGL